MMPGAMFHLINQATGRHLDGRGGEPTGEVYTEPYNDGDYQWWEQYSKDGVVYFQHVQSGLFLDGDGQRFYLHPGNWGDYQQFTLQMTEQNRYQIIQVKTKRPWIAIHKDKSIRLNQERQ